MATAIWLFIVSILAPLVTRILVAAGVGFAVYSGVDTGLDLIETYVQSQFSGLPAYMLALIGVLKLDIGISVIIAALSGRIAMKLVSGTVQSPLWRKPGTPFEA